MIGAGMAGLACARAAQNAGVQTTVFEKSRGVGGRLATRRPFGAEDPMALDHGAPFAEPSKSYPDTATRLPTLGVRWGGAWPEDWGDRPTDEVLGLGGMSNLARGLVAGAQADEASLNVVLETEIKAIAPESGRWLLQDDVGERRGPFDAVVSAAPAPQTRALLGDACPAVETEADFYPVWAVLAVFDPAPSEARHAALIQRPEPPLARVFRQSVKPGRALDQRDAWVGHASSEWSAFHLEQDKAAVADALLPALLRSLGLDPAAAPPLAYLAAHRWRYGVVRKAVGDAYWLSEPSSGAFGPLGCCGDWRVGPKAGDALASGERMGAAIAARLLGS